jgi:Pentapeptide repeats (8 copies)
VCDRYTNLLYCASYLESPTPGVSTEPRAPQSGVLEGADLSGAQLEGADLRGVDLSKARGVTRAQVEVADTDAMTTWPVFADDDPGAK